MDLQIRPASTTDAGALGPLFAAWEHPLPTATLESILAQWAATERAAFLVAEADPADPSGAAGLAGFVAIVARPGLSDLRPVAHLSGLAVAPQLRRRGVAGRLLTAAEALATQWGCSRVELSSSLTRDAAHRFYPAAGYHDSTVHHAYYSKRLTDRYAPG